MSSRVPCPSCGEPKLPRSEMCRPCRDKVKGEDHPAWKGGKIIDSDGYVRVYAPDDPRANCGRYMKEHTLVMEETLGRQLLPGENVHHKNGVRSDNRPENLELWIGSQPVGCRVEDAIKWAHEILERYVDKDDGVTTELPSKAGKTLCWHFCRCVRCGDTGSCKCEGNGPDPFFL